MDRFSNEQRALWQRICTHPLVRPELGRDFRAQLAAEQGWNLAEADAAIEELKRLEATGAKNLILSVRTGPTSQQLVDLMAAIRTGTKLRLSIIR